MSKILISGCGITWSRQERPNWARVLKICGVDIDDRAGPAISNQTILNSMIESVLENDYDQAICQLTSDRKLDIELTSDARREAMSTDGIRNFTHGDIWPSSESTDHACKRMYYDYIYSPGLEQSDIIYKWMLLDRLCQERDVKLHTVLGYRIPWQNKHYTMIRTDHDYNIWDDYVEGPYWQHHDHSVGKKNTVPNKFFQIHLAKKFNTQFLKLDIEHKLEKFDA